MDATEFRRRGKEMVDYMADYLENIRDRPPMAQVKPGYLRPLVPDEAPEDPEGWEDIFKDIERVIMPGVTHWQSPQFHAYFPTGNSYAAICADMLSDAIGCLGFSWVASPACTELEMVVLDWLGKAIGLPAEFLSGGKGGGVIQGSASEATLITLLAARSRSIQQQSSSAADVSPGSVKSKECHHEEVETGSGHPTVEEDSPNLSKMVIYCSDQAHLCVEKAALLGAVKCHQVESDERDCLRGPALQKAIDEDRAKGLIPFFCVATLGTTPTCAFDNIQEIGPICKKENVWMHVDAAYAGSAFICPEFRHLMNGVEFVDSFNFDPHKWLQINFDCSTLWMRESRYLVESFRVDPLYLRNRHDSSIPDYRHWQISFGRRFRSLKLWFVLRLHGIKGLREYIRKQVSLAKEFEALVRSDDRFQVAQDVLMGLVCFRLKGGNDLSKALLELITSDGRIHIIPSESKGKFFLRFCVCASKTESSDINFAWKVIHELADKVKAQ